MFGGGAAMTRTGLSGPVYAIQGAHFYNVGDAFSAVDGKLGQLDYRVNQLEQGRDIRKQLATSSRWLADPSQAAAAQQTPTPVTVAAPPAINAAASAPAIARDVATGAVPTDAANLGQLEEALVSARRYADTATRQATDEAKAYTDQRLVNVVVDTDFNAFKSSVNTRFRSLDTRLNRVGAMGTALAGMAGAIAAASGTGSRVSAAVGGYRGQGALAIGFAQRIPGSGAVLLGGSLAGGGESSGTLGVSFGW